MRLHVKGLVSDVLLVTLLVAQRGPVMQVGVLLLGSALPLRVVLPVAIGLASDVVSITQLSAWHVPVVKVGFVQLVSVLLLSVVLPVFVVVIGDVVLMTDPSRSARQ